MTAAQPPDTHVPPRSSFVTVVAWIFLAFSGFSTFIGAVQNVMIRSMPFAQMDTMLRDSTTLAQIPGPARFMLPHLRLFFLLAFLTSLVMFVASLGLLRRRNWARLLFMGMLVLGIIYMIAGLFIQQSFVSSFDTALRTGAAHDSAFRTNADQFRSMLTAMRIFMAVFSLAMAGLFAWIVARLASINVRAEFTLRAA